MTGRYAAFTFCDRIVEHVPARHARAVFAVTPSIDRFPAALCAEATGQLAAWVSMAHIGFRGRPVAALAREVRFHDAVKPGETLSLEVDVEECDESSVFYQGRARIGERLCVELVDCLGPMLPQDEYDSAEDLAREFLRLEGPGERPHRFGGIGPLPLETVAADGDSRSARLLVPAEAPFFADHFPRRPVFPATLLLDQAMHVAAALVDEGAPQRHRPARVNNVKMRDFIAPGDAVLLTVTRTASRDAELPARVKFEATIDGRTMATAQIGFALADVEVA